MQLVKTRWQQQAEAVREHNYQVLKALVIEAMRDRQSCWIIDFGLACDIAWHIAESLPPTIRLEQVSLTAAEKINNPAAIGKEYLQVREIEFEEEDVEVRGMIAFLLAVCLTLIIIALLWL